MKGKLLTFLLGLALGATGAVFLPPLLPAGLRPGGEEVEGIVIRRQRDQERLLLTVDTPQGAALATFTEKVAEIDLLVEEGDAVTLGLGAYEPFVDNPPIRSVRKNALAAAAPGAGSPAEETEAPAASPPDGEPMGDPPADDQLPGDDVVGEAPDAEAELEQWPGDGDGG